jgi:hypothetical protein
VTADARDLELDGLSAAQAASRSDAVLVPRPLAAEMSQAIAAMQKLAAEGMVEVAKGLGLIARRKPAPHHPPCEGCGVQVWVGLPHAEECASPEALRHRCTDVPGLADDD